MPLIRRIEPADLPHAPGPIAALIDALDRAHADHRQLWGSFDESDRLTQAAVVIPQTGRTALLFTNRPPRRKAVGDLARVINVACGALPPGQATLAQALIDPGDDLRRDAFADAGFWPLATLSYMQRRLPRTAAHPEMPAGVSFEPYREAAADDFMHVLEASYDQTLDCPALQGLRHTADVLAGHRGAGRFDPELWTLMRVEGEPAGVLLLNPIPGADCVELVYLGLATAHRQRGYGSLLMKRALALCVDSPMTYLTLAVDESNAPAVALYHRTGLRRTMRKIALVRTLGSVPEAPPTARSAPA